MKRIFIPALLAVFTLGGCRAEPDELPETAEVEVEDGALEYDEELVLTARDAGETILATGWVSGAPMEEGFFLRTEADRVIFVESQDSVATGDAVRVTGPLAATQVPVFEEWEADAFDAGFELEWDVETALYIDAATVEPM